MKKLVLIIFSALIMTIFIALNYLLWDREKRIDMDADKMASIDTLSSQIRSLTDENRQLRVKILEQDDSIKSLQVKLIQADQDKNKVRNTLQQKDDVINILKQQVDIKPMEAAVRKWVDSIDKGQYEIAYDLQFRGGNGQDKTEFINNYKNSVKSMKIKTVALAVEGVPNEKRGEIIFKAVLDVKKAGVDGKISLIEGVNERFFSVKFDKDKNEWIISDIYMKL
mgnify:CR=1 FL=1